MARRISIVIPNWNGAKRLQTLLKTLEQQTERACQVLVVDNASSDNSCEIAQAHGAQWLPLERNYGFARAVNTGVRQAQAEDIAILNNDITLAPDCLERLGGALTDSAFAVPKILKAADPARLDGTFDLTSRGFCSWRAGHNFPANSPDFNRPRAIASAPLTAAVFRRSVFDQVGLLDEQFGSYLEDVDFGLRCALKGITGRYEPAAVATHEGSATLGGAWNPRSTHLIARNQVILAKKYGVGASWPVVVGQSLWGLAALKNGAGRAWIQGKIEGCRTDVETLDSVKGRLPQILHSQEQEIRRLLAARGTAESYWRLYFALTRGSF